MDKEKRNARQARYRQKETRARLDLMVSPELLERFRTLPGLDGKTNAEKLEALCNAWNGEAPGPDPKATEKALSLAFQRIDALCQTWIATRPAPGLPLEAPGPGPGADPLDTALALSLAFEKMLEQEP